MKIVIFGLAISSSWGNGHATLWRGLCRGLIRRGHTVTFFERDAPYYAEHRDLTELTGGKLLLYPEWETVRTEAEQDIREADAVIVTSYCPDALEVGELLRNASALRVFYDLDTPVTLARLHAGEAVPYIGERGLSEFDLVLSFTGGGALDELHDRLGAQKVAPLYGSVDPEVHQPAPAQEQYRADLSYLGTYAVDRQEALTELFIEPARGRPADRFVIGGAQYPQHFPWAPNIHFVRHLPPGEHPAFFASSRWTLNVTRRAMAQYGFCPSGRLFEAAACGVPMISDSWPGLDEFFTPGTELIVAGSAADVLNAMDLSDGELRSIADSARERVLAEHTSERRAEELEALLERQPSQLAEA
ncbi:MAG TPA: glycosyltransferase [Chthoniobacteraceae bacterium]|nr:glycosyltransferase [Chthoniobacteraceae bacterium]